MGRKGRTFKRLSKIIFKFENQIYEISVDKREKVDKNVLKSIMRSEEEEKEKPKVVRLKKVKDKSKKSEDETDQQFSVSESYLYDTPFIEDFCYDDEMAENMFLDKEQDLYFANDNC